MANELHETTIMRYRDSLKHTQQASGEQNNPAMDNEETTMGFFIGLDNAQFAEFKTEI